MASRAFAARARSSTGCLGPAAAQPAAHTALLAVHAINPHGFAWLRRVTEEGCDLNRNFVDFAEPLPTNAGYDELAAEWLPPQLQGPEYDKCRTKIREYRAKHGEKAYMEARSGGQWKDPHGFFYGGAAPTWSRRTLEAIIADEKLAGRRCVAVIDHHTGLVLRLRRADLRARARHPQPRRGAPLVRRFADGPFARHSLLRGQAGPCRARRRRLLAERFVYVALEYGTYPSEATRRAMQEDHGYHRRGAVDWDSAEVQRAKQALKRHYYPGTRDWQEMVLFRSRQIIRQALAG